MKGIKFLSIVGMFALMFNLAYAQLPANPPAAPTAATPPPASAAAPTVKGTLDIDYKSRTATDKYGVEDVYKMDVVAVDTLVLNGTINHLSPIFGEYLGGEKQQAKLTYSVDLHLRNPANLSQQKKVGKLTGVVPIDATGKYLFDQGTLRMAVEAIGKAAGFQSDFRGTAAGRAPKTGSMAEKAKKVAIEMTRSVKGKNVKIVVVDFDEMKLNGLRLAAGPTPNYPETTVNGEMVYDYERGVWFFRNVTMSYPLDGKTYNDTLSGNIRWVEGPNRKTTGEGQYEFDVRVNEPAAKTTEAAAFQGAADESDFFAVDATMPSLTGLAKYKDTFRGDTVTASKVNIDLVGNNLTKQQVVNLTKLIWLVSVVPINAE